MVYGDNEKKQHREVKLGWYESSKGREERTLIHHEKSK
jgi:hypothetical protein